MKRFLFAGLLGAVLAVPPVLTSGLHASTLTVTSANDSGPGSLRDTIALASPGDTIHFQPSLLGVPILLSSGELVIDRSLRIESAGFGGIILDGNSEHAVFVILRDSVVELSGLTIQNGGDDNELYPGGGIASFGNLTLDHCVVRNSLGRTGGGIHSVGILNVHSSWIDGNHGWIEGGGIYSEGMLLVSNSTLSNNSAGANPGGGIDNYGIARIVSSSIVENSAKPGGGIFNYGSIVVEGSLITKNHGNYLAAGIVNFTNGSLVIARSTVSENSGAGGFGNLGTATILNSMIMNNSGTESYAGGVTNFPRSVLNLENSTISENANFGLVVLGGEANIASTTITNNSAYPPVFLQDLQAVGLANYHSQGTVTLRNSLIAGNYWETEPAPSTDCNGSITSLGHNLVGNGTGCEGLGLGVNGDIVGVDPTVLFEAHPADNGGPTYTLALLPDSPAIDRTPPESCVNLSGGLLSTDQRGVQRPQGAGCDIGAFEFSNPRSVSFWAQQCRGEGAREYNSDAMQELLSQVLTKYAPAAKCVPVGCDLLTHGQPAGNIQALAARELLASWLNLASGKLTLGRPVSLGGLTDATTGGAALSEVEAVVCAPQARRADLRLGLDIAKALNSVDEK